MSEEWESAIERVKQEYAKGVMSMEDFEKLLVWMMEHESMSVADADREFPKGAPEEDR